MPGFTAGSNEYREHLNQLIRKFLKVCPVPIVAEPDAKNNSITFFLGKTIAYSMKLDMDIASSDQIALLDNYFRPWFPTYSVVTGNQIQIPYNPSEILTMIQQEGIPVDRAMEMKKTVLSTEWGMIERIFIKKDEFKLLISENEAPPRAKYCVTVIPISQFLKKIRLLREDDEALYRFIKSNSKIFHEAEINTVREVNYRGKMLINSIKIQKSIIPNSTVIRLSPDRYKLGKLVYTIPEDQMDLVWDEISPCLIESLV